MLTADRPPRMLLSCGVRRGWTPSRRRACSSPLSGPHYLNSAAPNPRSCESRPMPAAIPASHSTSRPDCARSRPRSGSSTAPFPACTTPRLLPGRRPPDPCCSRGHTESVSRAFRLSLFGPAPLVRTRTQAAARSGPGKGSDKHVGTLLYRPACFSHAFLWSWRCSQSCHGASCCKISSAGRGLEGITSRAGIMTW